MLPRRDVDGLTSSAELTSDLSSPTFTLCFTGEIMPFPPFPAPYKPVHLAPGIFFYI